MNREWGSEQNHSERETYNYKQTKFKYSTKINDIEIITKFRFLKFPL